MMIKILDKEGQILPSNAHPSDSGYDLTATSDPKIVGVKDTVIGGFYKRIDYIEYDTGIQIEHESITSLYGFTQVYPRSSISKYNLILKNSVGVIDHQYRDSIKLRFAYLWQIEDIRHVGSLTFVEINKDKIYKKGDKIGQLLGMFKQNIDWKVVNKLNDSDRNMGGFGSTGL